MSKPAAQELTRTLLSRLAPDRGCVRKEGANAVFAPSGAGKSVNEQELRDASEEPDGLDDEQPAERPGM